MNKHAILHIPYSEYCYQVSENTFHILLRAEANDIKQLKIIYGDPCIWKDSKWVYNSVQMLKKYHTNMFDYFFVSLTSETKRIKYMFEITTFDNEVFYYNSKGIVENIKNFNWNFLKDFFNIPYILESNLHHTPKWVKNTIWYQIFPDRF